MEESGLASSGLAHQGQHFTALDVKVEARENDQIGRARTVNFSEITSPNVTVGHLFATITHIDSRKRGIPGASPSVVL
jgi:hypothetical protein